MNDIKDKVALITGGGRGIGRAIALELAQRGAQVAVAARSSQEIETVAAEIRERGQTGRAFTADLSDHHAAQKLVADVEQTLGPVSILINNAAIAGPFGPTWEIKPEEWERALRVNLLAPFWLTQLVLPDMFAAAWGRIINVSSGAARNPMERSGPYSVSKAALDMLSRQLGSELEETEISAISVYPGVVDTVMQTSIREQPTEVVGQNLAQRFRQYYEGGQLQPPERPARLIAALAGAAGATFNGQIVDIYTDTAQQLMELAEA
jgi:NAD(P)-dependent dehydrogenase (short-subunit alcohol dehydrogenase family)